MFRRMRIRSLDLYEALRAYGLIATSCLIEIWRIIEEANWAFQNVFVQIGLDRLAINLRFMW